MSTPAHKANLARIRDNQRRSRARRREYLQELEQRLRVYEIQGIHASYEVQQAAQRVAEENRQLRGLLNRHGIAEGYISSYLQAGGVAAQAGPAQAPHFTLGSPGEAAHPLQQQVPTSRRAAPFSTDVSYAGPPQETTPGAYGEIYMADEPPTGVIHPPVKILCEHGWR
ncbi:hypothetical protein CEP51_016491 [Fusarium floridanum]|uniref:BZIP domain-containing protein n=1 Tax=Fusarium floridanum TaxID=1325733 RepID=A0A428NNI4_9HYPO|nr:hypothetical protein CEP51_016491 [Fusarium floridanum]